ncbi:MAG TPA: hypothetical protein PLC13_01970 [Bacillota bacterium]|nr:hypothetical protein [Bacillota bacterium]
MIKKAIKNRKGISIPIVMAVAVILLVIGAVIMSVASGNLGTSNQEKNTKQAYFVAKSSIDVIDRSIRNGDMGEHIKNMVLTDLINSGNTAVNKNWGPFTSQVSFSGKGLGNFSAEDMQITFKSSSQATSGSGSNLQSATVTINEMKVSFKSLYNDRESYRVTVTYSYTGYANIQNGSRTWGTETWTLVDIK